MPVFLQKNKLKNIGGESIYMGNTQTEVYMNNPATVPLTPEEIVGDIPAEKVTPEIIFLIYTCYVKKYLKTKLSRNFIRRTALRSTFSFFRKKYRNAIRPPQVVIALFVHDYKEATKQMLNR